MAASPSPGIPCPLPVPTPGWLSSGMGVPSVPAPVRSYLLQGAELAAEVRDSGNIQRWCGCTPKVPVWETRSNTEQEERLEWLSCPGEHRGHGCSAGAGHRGVEHCINI